MKNINTYGKSDIGNKSILPDMEEKNEQGSYSGM